MKVNDFSLIRLRNEEHFQFHTSFSDLVVATNATNLKIEALFAVYQPQLANELKSLDVVRKSSISDDLLVADSDRDDTIRGFRNGVKSGLNHYDANVQAAAKRLQILLDTYGDLPTKNYDAETGAINSLVSDLKGTYAADVATMGLTGWVNELAARNTAFDDLKNNRYSDEASKTMLHMKAERRKTDSIYRQITERINALIIVEGEAAYAGFVNELNKRIEGFDNTVTLRRAKAKKAADVAPEAK